MRPPLPSRSTAAHRVGSAAARRRCPWCGTDPIYVRYHDDEWGVPETDDRALFEKLVLDGFQAGLSWIIVLRKRDAFRRAFDGFEPARVARYTPAKLAALNADAGIVRNRAKIQASVANARAYLRVVEEQGGFARYLWSFVDGEMIVHHRRRLRQLPAESKESRALAKDLRARGFRFCGPTIVYAFMQAVGMVNDHLVDCHRHPVVTALGRRLPAF
ncbi:MAG: DNA-3-methyladenine glycosylase I [Deltaproteobacteria bacterium]|nr:DNA-3-methyladenine glycosylase I [Deltaproteobacteria bacterium]